ncbi:hypothetical protein CSKR_109948 [Clonorchis sinensis]|uniref:Uncharacterized protein n=1 Tax=Clonorchis sinensis TaxID=79923 RepID=A0A3R7FAG4_CLOSI|nr:hypothetical protein CSKR_109948 [Clonorchis sinensis]
MLLGRHLRCRAYIPHQSGVNIFACSEVKIQMRPACAGGEVVTRSPCSRVCRVQTPAGSRVYTADELHIPVLALPSGGMALQLNDFFYRQPGRAPNKGSQELDHQLSSSLGIDNRNWWKPRVNEMEVVWCNRRQSSTILSSQGRQSLCSPHAETIIKTDGSCITNTHRRSSRWAEHCKARFKTQPAHVSTVQTEEFTRRSVPIDPSSIRGIQKSLKNNKLGQDQHKGSRLTQVASKTLVIITLRMLSLTHEPLSRNGQSDFRLHPVTIGRPSCSSKAHHNLSGRPRLGQPGSIPALVLPSGGMAARYRKGATAERFFSLIAGKTETENRRPDGDVGLRVPEWHASKIRQHAANSI